MIENYYTLLKHLLKFHIKLKGLRFYNTLRVGRIIIELCFYLLSVDQLYYILLKLLVQLQLGDKEQFLLIN